MLPRATTLAVVSVLAAIVCARPVAAQQRDPWKAPTRAGEVVFPVLQGLDLHASRRAVAQGGREVNPIMGGPLPAQIALKSGASAAMVFFAEKTRKQHPRAAFWVMWASNGAYAAIVARNYALRR
jgi:hypothetical protein